VTESSESPKPKRVSKAAAKSAAPVATKVAAPKPVATAAPKPGATAKLAASAKPARSRKAGKQVAVVAPEPTHRHPNLGLAPLDMEAGFTAEANVLRRDRAAIAAAAVEAAVAADPDLQLRFDDAGLRQLLHDAEVLIDRLAMCLDADDVRPMAEYAEWIGPILRRRGVSLWDLVEICNGIREIVAPTLGQEASKAMNGILDAAIDVLRKNGRLGGDPHKRNALLKWFYRGV
jgi:hypothetical protein